MSGPSICTRCGQWPATRHSGGILLCNPCSDLDYAAKNPVPGGENHALSSLTEKVGRGLLRWISEEAEDGSNGFFGDETSEELCPILQKYGFVRRERYDPNKHGEVDCVEPGDEMWVFTELFKEATK